MGSNVLCGSGEKTAEHRIEGDDRGSVWRDTIRVPGDEASGLRRRFLFLSVPTEPPNDRLDVGLGFEFAPDGLADPDVVGVGLVVPEILGARVLGEGVSDREVAVRDGGPADRTPVSLVRRDLMDEELLGVLGRVLTAADSALPHGWGMGIPI